MEISIEKTSENSYLSRKEVHGKVSFTGATPSQKQVADSLAAKLNAKADAIFVNHVFTSFGSQSATFEAHLYPSKEQLDKVVRLGKKAKEKLAKATAAPAAVAADQPAKPALPTAAQAEAPKAETKKEEAKSAEKAAEPKKAEAKPEAKSVEAKKEEPKKAEAKKEEPKKEKPKKVEA